MDISEVAGRAVMTFSPQRQAGLTPGSQIAPGAVDSRDAPVSSQTVQAVQSVQAQSETQSTRTDDPFARNQDQKGSGGLEAAVEKVQKFVSVVASDVEFVVDEDSGDTVVKVIDRETKEVIRQIPSEEMLDLAHALDKLQGLLIKQEA
ncbi:MAG: flagellar protein FlaG [Candidatus Accumulibacter sp.]|nr:flagellar protein FlaG [Accumulibacter sp.]